LNTVGGLLASNFYLLASIGALLLPAVWSLIFGIMALRLEESERAANWPVYLRRMRILNLLAVPAWWSVFGALLQSGAKLNPILDWPAWVLLVFPLSAGIAEARFIAGWVGNRIDGRHLTIVDLFRLSIWGSFSSSVPLLLFAVGIDAFANHSFFAVLWIGGAGLLARFAKAGLRSAEGLKPRLVRSGDLYKRAFVMAKQMGVHLIGVFVYPTGRGRLTNAHGGAGFIGMTDVCIHWLHGPQLDFVIGHELAHLQQEHGQRERRIDIGVYLGIAALALAMFHLPLLWQVVFKFGVILIPLLVCCFVSRRFEFEADRIAVESTGDGEVAVRALAALYWRSGIPAKCNNFDELFLTHPSLSKRIEAVACVGQVSAECVTQIRQQFEDRAGGLPVKLD
jgi:Zn-dependent protease with chaperone function